MCRVMAAMVEAKFGPMPAADVILFQRFALDMLEEFGLAIATAVSYDELRERFFTP